jgi:WD40 repeat protein
MITTTGKLRVYSLAKYEGIFLREISSAHRGNIVSLDVSTNSGYMITGGEDNMLKVWDYEADKASPFYF